MMNFENALTLLKAGKMVVRRGWSGNEEYVIKSDHIFQADGKELNVTPYFLINVIDEGFSIWTPSACDVLAEDWILIEG